MPPSRAALGGYTKLYVFLYAVAHFAVDALSLIIVLSPKAYLPPSELFNLVVFYLALAFATQPILGALYDKGASAKRNIVISFGLMLLGTTTILPNLVRAALAGLGNSLFHIAAGAEVLETAKNKMWSLGTFVAPGAIGLAVGLNYNLGSYPSSAVVVLMVALGVVILALPPLQKPGFRKAPFAAIPDWVSFALIGCTFIRSFVGYAQGAPLNSVAFAPFIVAGLVFSGKFFGGFLSDAFTIRRVLLVSIPLAFIFFLLGKSSFVAFGLSQFCVNLSMPLALYLLYRCMPDRPGMTFGLSTGILLPGFLVAQVFPGSRTPTFVFASLFALNMALLLTVNRLMTGRVGSPSVEDASSVKDARIS